MKPNVDEEGNVARAISERTDGVPLSVGSACICTASHETPTNIAIAIAPRVPRVAAGLRPCGRRKALTPLAIASTPVNAVDPEAKARRMTNVVTMPVPAAIGCGATACGQPLTAHFVTPTPISAK